MKLASLALAVAALSPLAAQATTITFNTLPAGITFDGGSMQLNTTGGAHLYQESWGDDDFINFAAPTTVNSFQMNREPWQGYSGSTPSGWNARIEAFDSSNHSLWSKTVNLAAYDQWNEWLTVDVNTAGVSKLAFYATGAVNGGTGFWPSVDNLVINEALANAVPEPSSLALVGLAFAGLALSRRRKSV